jgi:hypothetical protein
MAVNFAKLPELLRRSSFRSSQLSLIFVVIDTEVRRLPIACGRICHLLLR